MFNPDRRGTVRLLLASLGFAFAKPVAASVAPPTPWLRVDDDQTLTRIAFGSCLDQRRAQPIWSSVLQQQPDLFVMLGDNVYGDVTGPQLTELRTAYTLQSTNPALAEVRAKVPFLATWDDHDYGLNDAGGDFPYKAASRELFADYWQLTPDMLPTTGIYRAHVIGPPGRRVQIILLDLRSFRARLEPRSAAERKSGLGRYAPDTDLAKSLLGEAQWRWLAAQLRQPADLRLIGSSIQVLAEEHGWERWGNLPLEQARLFDVIRDSGARGVVLLSGDRHRAAIYRRQDLLPYTLYDATSSSLNRSIGGAEPDDPGRLAPMLIEDNYGLIAIDWAGRRITVSLHPVSGRDWPSAEIAFADVGLE